MKSRKRGRSINQVEEHLSISLSLYLFTNGQIHARTQPLLWSRALHLREAPMGPVEDKLVFNHAFEQRASITKDRDQDPCSSPPLALTLALTLALALLYCSASASFIHYHASTVP